MLSEVEVRKRIDNCLLTIERCKVQVQECLKKGDWCMARTILNTLLCYDTSVRELKGVVSEEELHEYAKKKKQEVSYGEKEEEG